MIDLSFTEKASRMQNTPQRNLEWRLSEDSLPICLLQTKERVTRNLGSCTDLTFTSTVTRQLAEWTSRQQFWQSCLCVQKGMISLFKNKIIPNILYTRTLSLYILDKSQRSFFSKSRQSSVQWWERGTALGRNSVSAIQWFYIGSEGGNSKNSYKKAFLSKFQWIRAQVVFKEDLQ